MKQFWKVVLLKKLKFKIFIRPCRYQIKHGEIKQELNNILQLDDDNDEMIEDIVRRPPAP